MNIICILASGVGNRFGSSIPKQYHLVNGRPVIEYTITAAIKSTVDEIILVANEPYKTQLENKYGIVAVEGGKTRNKSLIKGLEYIKENYTCEKIIVIDAVCPLVTSELLNLYINFLNEYDAVFTTSKIPTSLGKYDGSLINREDYFMIQSPDAYRFNILYDNFKDDPVLTTPLHLLPADTKIKYYFGFTNYAKIIYPHDIAIIEALLTEQLKVKKIDTHNNDIALNIYAKMRQINKKETRQWEKVLDNYLEELYSTWGIVNWSVNGDGYSGLVIEGISYIYGNVVLKIYAPFIKERFVKEITVLKGLDNYHQAKLLDYDESKNALLLSHVIPGNYIDFYEDQEIIKALFVDMEKNKKKAKDVENSDVLKDVLELTEIEWKTTKKIKYHQELMGYLMEEMRTIYHEEFSNDEFYILHGDAYFKNALRGKDEVLIIDPVGYNAPFIFEYMSFFTYEILWHSNDGNYAEKYNELIDFFKEFIDVSRFKKASFVFFIKQIVPSVYEANDNYARANAYLDVIKTLYLNENNRLKDDVFDDIYM